MTEYWKSIPKKFCDLCKCWFQDNKASIDFHERGSRHKANVQQRIQDSQQKGKSNLNAKTATDTDMQKIEAAAMAAYARDLAANPSLIQSYGVMPAYVRPQAKVGESSKSSSLIDSIPIVASSSTSQKPSDAKLILGQEKALDAITSKQKKMALATASRKWKEAKSDDNFSYFYNLETAETRWDAPPEGYLSLADQQDAEGKAPEESVPALRTKPLPPPLGTPGALGNWLPVGRQQEWTAPDLGLIPASRSAASDLAIEMHNTAAQEFTGILFKTKTVASLGPSDGQDSTFKKRKVVGDSKRQVRRREE